MRNSEDDDDIVDWCAWMNNLCLNSLNQMSDSYWAVQ